MTPEIISFRSANGAKGGEGVRQGASQAKSRHSKKSQKGNKATSDALTAGGGQEELAVGAAVLFGVLKTDGSETLGDGAL